MDLAILLGYVGLQLAVGLFVARDIKTESDYLLAGRRLGPRLAMFTIFATWFGAETCVGAAGRFYKEGLSGGAADPFGYALCILVMGLVFARKLWSRGLTTLADLFRERYSPGVERIAVLLMVPTSLLWASAQIRAFGHVITHVSDMPLEAGISVAALVVVLYTVFGGLMADVCTDVVQGIVLAVGLIVLGVLVATQLGDPRAVFAEMSPERYSLFSSNQSVWDILESWCQPILGSLVAQELIARISASRSAEIARKATLQAALLYCFIGIIPAAIGFVARDLVGDQSDPEQVLVAVAEFHFHRLGYLIFAGALISAILSTVDSALLVSGSLLSHNLVVPLRPKASEQSKVKWARIGVVLSGIIAYGLALAADSVHEQVELASGFGSAGLLIAMIFALFGRFGTPLGAAAAMITGAIVFALGSFGEDLSPTIASWIPYPFLTSLAAALLAFLAGSLAKQRR